MKWQYKSDDSRLPGFKSLIVSIFLLLKGGLQGRDGKETELITKNFNKQSIKLFCFLLWKLSFNFESIITFAGVWPPFSFL